MIETFRTISIKIKNSYNLSDDIKINFVDVFVVKYKFNEQNYLEIHKDGSFLSFNILLSNPNDFDGGGTYFDDGLIMKPDQGDLIIHSSKIKHSGLPITKGTRYLLVGFINLNLFVNNSD
jgi:predicted 2-oxoglutarate/Fe(II)-dependent dioxygenase YbiX